MSTDTPPAFDRYDPLGLDASLSADELAVRDTVRQFCAEQITPFVTEWFENGDLPVARELAKQFGQLGLLGMHLHGYGCGGSSAVHYGLACLELEAADSGIRSLVSVQGSLAMFAIWHNGSEEQKQQWLPRMAAGELVGCFGLTEPDAGSDPAAMKTRARRDGSDWVLDGRKMWITNGSIADLAIVWAGTDEGIRGFIVPTDTPGFTANTIHHKLSLRASITSELVLDDVRLPAEAMLPNAIGLRAPLACLSEARYGIAWGAMGAARSAWQSALDYATHRTQFGRPIAGFQLTQAKLVDMAVELHKGQLLALHLGRLKDRVGLRPEQVSFGKLNNTREAIEICRTARTILGGNGISLEYPVIRHMVNLESVLTYEGTPRCTSWCSARPSPAWPHSAEPARADGSARSVRIRPIRGARTVDDRRMSHRIVVAVAVCGLSLGALTVAPKAAADPTVTLPPMTSTGSGPMIAGTGAAPGLSQQLTGLNNPNVQEVDGSDAAQFITAAASVTDPQLAAPFVLLHRALACQGNGAGSGPRSGPAPTGVPTGGGEARCWSRPRAPPRTSMHWSAASRPIGAAQRRAAKTPCATTAGPPRPTAICGAPRSTTSCSPARPQISAPGSTPDTPPTPAAGREPAPSPGPSLRTGPGGLIRRTAGAASPWGRPGP
ncbi:hypothetical protein NIIDMKKI_68460 [Mycobacterium kansasii]|uniref:glutaryl-CoA dehydrogenase (ETF) n=1 Tax=Mycobacterium kansasii TaxID=1768 RepID=A0A7G1IL98_MYCKA|nr:hypothetical protein NIIDMKKI_68460 [Mycobacterium kansasii]